MIIVLPAGWTMQNPPEAGQVHRPKIQGRSVVESAPFVLLYLAMFTGLVAGFTVNANLKELYTEGSPMLGVAAVSFSP